MQFNGVNLSCIDYLIQQNSWFEISLGCKDKRVLELKFLSKTRFLFFKINQSLIGQIRKSKSIKLELAVQIRELLSSMFRERQELDDKLQELKFLSPMEESRMVELDESIEAVDAAIDYKNDVLLGVSFYLIICSETLKTGNKKTT